MEAHALRARGWSISAIARHLGRDRKTVRAYLNGEREPGKRRPAGPDAFAVVEDYCRIRLRQDPHLQATTLFEEVAGLGYAGAYSSFTRAIRRGRLRPHCEPCQQVRGRDVAIINHEPGEETQWDWVHLPDPPQGWGWPREAYLLVGSLPYSGRWRGWLSPSTDQPHLVQGLHEVCVRLGGLTLGWRFDRMSTVYDRHRDEVSATFAPVAKYYGVRVDLCPPRRGQRKGSVEKSNDYAAQRWWRTLGDEVTVERAQASLDAWCERTGDLRVRWKNTQKMTVATFAAAEPLVPLPRSPYPAELRVDRTVSPQALVCFDGNFYSVPPGHRGRQVTVTRRLDADVLDIVSAAGNTLARHRLQPRGAHAVVRADEHVAALEKTVLAAASDQRAPCRRKKRIPPSAEAQAEAERIRARLSGQVGAATATGDGGQSGPVVDFAAYAAAARPLTGGNSHQAAGDN
ncbi:IS21 family transposase [Microbispora hainanensis]|uniref:IS21 family transposase n=1 Tax=Microbispora hainanensis TaxID=568844 RepID=UPI001ABFE673|nr:IS21 family transposase [Microbispora hainanensis]